MNKNMKEKLIMKKRYLTWAQEADEKSPKSINIYERAIDVYYKYLKNKSLKLVNPGIVVKFKKSLKTGKITGNKIAMSTYCNYLRSIKNYFIWLSSQKGYKSRYPKDIITYLNPTGEERRLANIPKPTNYPSLEVVQKICKSIQIRSAIDLRDRAIIAFLFESGIRHKALISLPMETLDIYREVVDQDPRKNVKTKFQKRILTVLFHFDDDLINYIKEWVEYLYKEKGFGASDPLFPAAEIKLDAEVNCFVPAVDVIPVYWKSPQKLIDVLTKRCQEAGAQYFSPHSFRHGTIKLAYEASKNDVLAAISQTIGHSRVATTIDYFCKMSDDKIERVIKNYDFKNKIKKTRK